MSKLQSPGDKRSGCTWRVLARPTFVESTCVNARLDAAVVKAAPSCFAACKQRASRKEGPTAVKQAANLTTTVKSECFYRCYWLALHQDGAAELWDSILVPAFLKSWPGSSSDACPSINGESSLADS